MNTFNLKKNTKIAFYDDAKGQIQKQTRAFMNCWKTKMQSKKIGPQEAWMSCLSEYNSPDMDTWASKYAGGFIKIKKTANEITDRGSQKREKIEDAGLEFVRRLSPTDVILNENGKDQLYSLNDDFSGHVIVINGQGYEFIRSL